MLVEGRTQSYSCCAVAGTRGPRGLDRCWAYPKGLAGVRKEQKTAVVFLGVRSPHHEIKNRPSWPIIVHQQHALQIIGWQCFPIQVFMVVEGHADTASVQTHDFRCLRGISEGGIAV